MADEGPLVGVGAAAATAMLGVGGVLELGQGLARVLDAEIDDAVAARAVGVAAEVGDQRVVGVEDEAGAAGALGHQRRPIVGEGLDLPVAVELVAEEVAEDDQRGVELGRHLRQPGLVDLEEALAAALLEQRGRDAPGHVRPGPVVHRLAAHGGEDRGDHPGSRRLAVRGADHGRRVEPGAEAGDRVGGEAQEHAPGQRRAAAAAAGPAGDADRPRGRSLGSEQGPVAAAGAQAPARGGTITLSAFGSTRSDAGRSLMCSPSA